MAQYVNNEKFTLYLDSLKFYNHEDNPALKTL